MLLAASRRAGRGHLAGRALLAGLLLVCGAAPALAQDRERERRAMIRDIAEMAADSAAWTGRDTLSPAVMQAIERVPRDAFVPAELRALAYQNRPLPIGEGQTISQPYIVALMSDLLEVSAGDRVLEVGTGSGYQAAVLAEMGVEVYSIEIIESLATSAAERLARLGYDKVTVKAGDGYHGWPEHAPFNGIVVTAAPSHVPQPLVDQLAPGGVMVIPVGREHQVQQLVAIEKQRDGEVRTREVLPVRFVPLTGGH